MRTRIAIAKDQRALTDLFGGLSFQPLAEDLQRRAFARLDSIHLASTPVHSERLGEMTCQLQHFGLDEANPVAIRFPDSVSGSWFLPSDTSAMLRALSSLPQRSLGLFDIATPLLFVVHEAEYDWEYFVV